MVLQVIFEKNGEVHEIEVSKDVLLKDFLEGIQSAYGLASDYSQAEHIFVRTENPIGFLKGNKPLAAYGLRTASRIYIV